MVAGSAHLDVLARPDAESVHKDRIGEITFEVGGTGCNVAFDFLHLGCTVRLLTAWCDSPVSKMIEQHIVQTGVELHNDTIPGRKMAAFVAQMTVAGDLYSAVSSTPVDTHEFDDRRVDDALGDVKCVVVEANLNIRTLAKIAQKARDRGIPVYALAVSEDKVERLAALAGRINGAFMNKVECDRLMNVLGASDPFEVAEHFAAPLIITRGDLGAVVYSPSGERIRIPAPAIDEPLSLLGVGDAFSVGMIDGLVRHAMDFAAAGRYAEGLVRFIANLESCNPYSMNALNSMVGGLQADAHIDTLTGLVRRGAFERGYKRMPAGRNTLLLIDCDHFKSVNDTVGHDAGDQVLRQVAGIIKASIRANDVACRWGGDEFIVLLSGAEPRDAIACARRMIEATQNAEVHGVTLSVGMTAAHEGEALDVAMKRADEAMYQVKRNGKNGTVVL